MFSYNYTLYDPYNSLLFALSSKAAPSTMGDSIYIPYKTMLLNLRHEYVSKFQSLMHKEDFSIYPMAVRYARPDKNFYIIERPPFEVDIDYSNRKSYRQRNTPRSLSSNKIWVPWTVSILSWSNENDFRFQLYFNNQPLNSVDDLLVPSYLPNVDSSAFVCLGQDLTKVSQMIKKDSRDVSAIYNMAFNCYFSGWNTDLTPQFVLTPYIKDLIKNRILHIPRAPKDMIYDVNSNWSSSFSYKNYLTKVLFTFSHMSLDEIFKYIQSCKDYYVEIDRNSTLSQHLKRYGNECNLYSTYTPFPSTNDYLFFDDLLSLGQVTQPLRTDYTVAINNFSQDAPIASYTDNPYLIAEIYKHTTMLLHSGHTGHSVKQLSFDAKQLVEHTGALI